MLNQITLLLIFLAIKTPLFPVGLLHYNRGRAHILAIHLLERGQIVPRIAQRDEPVSLVFEGLVVADHLRPLKGLVPPERIPEDVVGDLLVDVADEEPVVVIRPLEEALIPSDLAAGTADRLRLLELLSFLLLSHELLMHLVLGLLDLLGLLAHAAARLRGLRPHHRALHRALNLGRFCLLRDELWAFVHRGDLLLLLFPFGVDLLQDGRLGF